MKVWTPENDRRLLIRLIERSAKAYDTVELAKLFRGATPKAIEERIAKLKREAKAAIASESDVPSGLASSSKSHAPHRAGKKRARASGGDGGGKRGAGKRKKTKAMDDGAREGEDDDEVKGGREREGAEGEGAKNHVATVERDPDETEEENVEQGVGGEVKMEHA